MLRILDRYLLRELMASFLAVTAVLLLITLGDTLIAVLNQIASGRVPAELLVALVALRAVDGLNVLLPLAAFLGVLLAFGRLYRDSEMAVLAASGFSLRQVFRALALMLLPIAAVLGALAFWIAPAAVRLSQQMIDEANRSLLIAGLEPGRFVALPGREGVIRVGGMSPSGAQFEHMFVESERINDDGSTRIDIVTARSGELYRDTAGGDRYLALHDGFRVEGRPGQDDFRLLRFARNDIRLAENDTVDNSDAVQRSAPTGELWTSSKPVQQAELHWRLAPMVSVLVLGLLALPLARTHPRQPRYGGIIIAVLAYILYANSLALGRSWMVQGELPMAWGFWWIYVPTALIAVWLIRRSGRLPVPRSARGRA